MSLRKFMLAALIASVGAATTASAQTSIPLDEVLDIESRLTKAQLEAKLMEAAGAATSGAPAVAAAPVAPGEANRSAPELESVMGVGDRLHATVIIDGRRHDVRPGDTPAGWKVISVDPDSVVLARHGVRHRLTFSQEIPPPPKVGMSAPMAPLMPTMPMQ